MLNAPQASVSGIFFTEHTNVNQSYLYFPHAWKKYNPKAPGFAASSTLAPLSKARNGRELNGKVLLVFITPPSAFV